MNPVQDLMKAVNYGDDNCGICGKKNGDAIWFHPGGNRAHKVCIKNFDYIEFRLKRLIKHLYAGKEVGGAHYSAHQHAIRAIKDAIKQEYSGESPPSLDEYLKEHGPERLTQLFNTIGIEAVIKHYGIIKTCYVAKL